MVGGTSDDDSLAREDYPEFARLQQRPWAAAAPYLVGAVLAWITAAFAEYQLTQQIYTQDLQHHALRQTILQVLSQALLYAGLGLFTVGLLVAALRQYARWQRDCDRWDEYPGGMEDEDEVVGA